jgi:ribose 5-phosphate isomerase A
MSFEDEKRVVGEAAAALVEHGMAVGLGTGSTVAFFLASLGRRELNVRCVATSLQTETTARGLGIPVEPFDELERLDLAVDGADQVAPDGWLVKGGGAALTREKIVAAAAERFVVIVSSDKLVEAIGPPIPLEILSYGARSTLARIGPAELRDVPPSPDGGLISDYRGPVDDPAALAAQLSAAPGVVEHGLFPPELVSEVFVGRGDQAERLQL